jgi:hypothetical protein
MIYLTLQLCAVALAVWVVLAFVDEVERRKGAK